MDSQTTKLLLIGNDLDYDLFKVAIDSAERGLSVWFISQKPFDTVPPGISKPCKEILKLITFMYIKSFEDLIRHLNGIHKWKHIPDVLILKDFDVYCSLVDELQKCAFLAANLVDSVRFLSKKKQHRTLLVASSSSEVPNAIERLQVLYDMYFDLMLFQSTLMNDFSDTIAQHLNSIF